jgi:hypothetical protein
MKPGSTRRFQISDGLVLIPAIGLGLGGCRLWQSPVGEIPYTLVWAILISVCSILLFGWTTALLLLRLGANRPRRRRLWCEPGFLACVAVVFAYVWNIVGVGILYAGAFMNTQAHS